VFLSALTEDFTVAILDQRGTGSSYPALEPTSTLTLDAAVQDVVDVAAYLSRRFDEPKIYVVGESWGTLLGVLAVQRAPERFAAFVGSGQMVSVRETDRRLYRDVLALAARTGDDDLAATMRGFGEPPYDDPFAYAFVASRYEELEPFTESAAVRALAEAPGNNVGFWGLSASEYTLMDRLNYARGLIDVFDLLYPQIQDVDLRQDAARLDVPVYVAVGEHELDARADLARQWFAALEAPDKELRTFEDSAHAPVAQDYQQFHDWLVATVLARTTVREGP
jgi:pimeloyl-ACP methyl ester carboxylesterase